MGLDISFQVSVMQTIHMNVKPYFLWNKKKECYRLQFWRTLYGLNAYYFHEMKHSASMRTSEHNILGSNAVSIATDKALFSSKKCWYISYFSTKTYLVVLIRSASVRPWWGASNEYPQHIFLLRNKKNIMWIPPLICSYVYPWFEPQLQGKFSCWLQNFIAEAFTNMLHSSR